MRAGGNALILALSMALVLAVVPTASAGPEPGLFCEEGEMVHDRLFPEPEEVNDFIGWPDALCGLEVLEERHPDHIEVLELGQSVGWNNLVSQGHDTFPVYAVEVTDETVPTKRGNLVFINSIHGNEKGAREGALRAIEDLFLGEGIAPAIEGATGQSVDQVLDELRLVFTFPNPDGWTHELPEYRHNDACYVSATCGTVTEAGDPGLETQGFVRVNGNGTDLNRQYATTGTGHPSWPAFTEPEIRAQDIYFDQLPEPTLAGVDLHGMLDSENLTYLMIKDTQRDLEEVVTHEAVARTTYEHIDADPKLDPWRAAAGPVSVWGATYDLLGYSAPGTGGGYIVQDIGLNAPGFTVEMAFNHIAFDNKYAGPGQQLNTMHVAATRDIVTAFVDFAYNAPDGVSVQGESTIGVLPHPGVIQEGRFNGEDADPNQAFRELAEHGADVRFLDDLTLATLDGFTHVVVPDLALDAYWETADVDAAAQADPLASLADWTRAGGTLVLTDAALEHAVSLGLADELLVVEDVTGKVDHIQLDHALAATTNEPVGSLVDGNPLNYEAGAVPNHCLDGFTGTIVGTRVAASSGMLGTENQHCTVLGEASLGEGTVRIMGAALPPPTGQGDHGVDGYALTPNGYRILANTLGLTLSSGAGQAQSAEEAGEPVDGEDIPGPAPLVVLALLAVTGAVLRSRRH